MAVIAGGLLLAPIAAAKQRPDEGRVTQLADVDEVWTYGEVTVVSLGDREAMVFPGGELIPLRIEDSEQVAAIVPSGPIPVLVSSHVDGAPLKALDRQGKVVWSKRDVAPVAALPDGTIILTKGLSDELNAVAPDGTTMWTRAGRAPGASAGFRPEEPGRANRVSVLPSRLIGITNGAGERWEEVDPSDGSVGSLHDGPAPDADVPPDAGYRAVAAGERVLRFAPTDTNSCGLASVHRAGGTLTKFESCPDDPAPVVRSDERMLFVSRTSEVDTSLVDGDVEPDQRLEITALDLVSGDEEDFEEDGDTQLAATPAGIVSLSGSNLVVLARSQGIPELRHGVGPNAELVTSPHNSTVVVVQDAPSNPYRDRGDREVIGYDVATGERCFRFRRGSRIDDVTALPGCRAIVDGDLIGPDT